MTQNDTITEEQRHKLSFKRWSYSSLKQFHSCPYAFFRRYVLEDYREAPNTFFGSAVHDYAEKYLLKQEPNVDEIFDEFKVPRADRASFDASVDNLKGFLDVTAFGNRFTPEQTFSFELQGYTFICILDLTIFKKDEILIYDWKSSKNLRYAKDHQAQMDLYHFALARQYPQHKIVIKLYYPRVDKTYDISPQRVTEVGLVNKVKEILTCDRFEPKPHRWCTSCPYFKKECPILS